VQDAAKLFERIDDGEIEGFITATTITNIYYIIRKAAGSAVAIDAISQILIDLHICTVDRAVIEEAIALNFKDFEDAVQYSCATLYGLDAIVTRDSSGFVNSEIPVMSPKELSNINRSE
jgi:predicted nucleic acid-binding protein